MKIAGRKNDGAWYRTNKVISTLLVDERAAFAEMLENVSEFSDVYETLTFFASSTGLSGPSIPPDVTALANQYAETGIPRQVWYGRLSFDTYTRSGSPGEYEYTPDHQAVMHAAGREIRKAVKNWIFSRRQARDLANSSPAVMGNPGGIADAAEDGPE